MILLSLKANSHKELELFLSLYLNCKIQRELQMLVFKEKLA